MAKLETVVKNLSKPLPMDMVDFRVQQVKANRSGVFAQLLAYKDARTDMEILDKYTGGMWQNRYSRDAKGGLVCEIGVKADDTEDFIWKGDVGTESNTESLKGEYSDAFKRSGFRWGIGRELYDYPFIFVNLNPDEYTMNGQYPKAKFSFKPNSWKWERVDGKLRATDNNGAIRFEEK